MIDNVIILITAYLACVVIATLAYFATPQLVVVYGLASWVGGVTFTLLVQYANRPK